MNVPFGELLRTALEYVEAHPAHDLSLQFRGKILTELLLSDGTRNSLVGQRRLVKLEEVSTRKVLSIWEAEYPQRDEPHELLAFASRFYGNNWDAETAQELRSHFPHEVAENSASLVLEAAAITLEVAIICSARVNEYSWDNNIYPKNADNRDLDYPDGWDSAYCASVVFSNGVSWSESSDNTKRFEFWSWWLEQAVPEAYKAF
jgi:Immunity protein Imm5